MRNQKILVLVSAAFALAVFTILVLYASPQGTSREQDFISFYSAGSIIRSGQRHSLYDYATELREQQKFTTHSEPLMFLHPAFEALLYAPLGSLGFDRAFTVWRFLNLGILALTLWQLRSPLRQADPLAVAMMGFFPVVTTLVSGQHAFWVLLPSTLGYLEFHRRQELKAGL